jgi:hypothetical protein
MSTRQTWVLATAAALAALILGASLGPQSAAQRAEQPKPEVAAGRYQAVQLAANGDSVLVLDTATGHCWNLYPHEQENLRWSDVGSPPQPKK